MTAAGPVAFYSCAEVAAQLGVSRRRVQQLVEAGEIPVLRLGSRLRVPREAWDRQRSGARVGAGVEELSGVSREELVEIVGAAVRRELRALLRDLAQGISLADGAMSGQTGTIPPRYRRTLGA